MTNLTETLIKPSESKATEPTVPPTSTFPEVIDNTIRSSFVVCPQQFLRAHCQGLRPKGATNVHLHAGGAFAKGLEVTRHAFYGPQHADSIQAEYFGRMALAKAYGDFECPEHNANKSLPTLERAFESYFMEYPLESDRIKPFQTANGEPAVEFTFAVSIPGTRHPVTGDPLLYAGRFDMLGLYNEQLFAVDEKTAGSLGDQWRRQWDLDSQFTGYCWAAQQYGYKVAGAIVRGVGLLKTKITHAEAIVYRPQWMIDRWLHQLIRDCKRMCNTWKAFQTSNDEGEFDFAIDKRACDAYSGCSFKPLCSTPEPHNWLSNYEVDKWNPLEKH